MSSSLRTCIFYRRAERRLRTAVQKILLSRGDTNDSSYRKLHGGIFTSLHGQNVYLNQEEKKETSDYHVWSFSSRNLLGQSRPAPPSPLLGCEPANLYKRLLIASKARTSLYLSQNDEKYLEPERFRTTPGERSEWLNQRRHSSHFPNASSSAEKKTLHVSSGFHSSQRKQQRVWLLASRPGLHIERACSLCGRHRGFSSVSSPKLPDNDHHSKRAVMIALLCNGFVLAMKVGIYVATSSSVMLAEAVHSLADLANQGLLAYGLLSSKRAPDAAHPYGYTKERFVWALISATGIFCLGAGVSIAHGIQCLYSPEEVQNVYMAAGVILVSAIMEGASFYVALNAVRASAKSERMTVKKYLWRGHDPTAVAVLLEDGAAVTGLGIAAASMTAVHITGNQIYDAIGSIAVGGLLGAVAVVLIGRNREALLGRSMEEDDVRKVIWFLRQDPVVDAIWDCKSEVIGPGAYRFKAEIDFNGVAVVQNYLNRVGKDALYSEVRKAVAAGDDSALDRVMGNYGEELMTALGSEVDRLEREIQLLVPQILHLDIEAHNPLGPAPKEEFWIDKGG